MEIKTHSGNSLSFLTVEPDNFDADESYPMVVLLHGYGSHMGDLAGLVQVIGRSDCLYAFPNAPFDLSGAYGMSSYAWSGLEEDSGSIPEGMSVQDMQKESERRLGGFFEELRVMYCTQFGHTVLGGFSQGAIMSYRFGLPRPGDFCGIVALSGRIQDVEWIHSRLPDDRSQPIFVAHGASDQVIPVGQARNSRQFLEEAGYEVEYHEYQMGHQISDAVIQDLVSWLSHVLPADAVSD